MTITRWKIVLLPVLSSCLWILPTPAAAQLTCTAHEIRSLLSVTEVFELGKLTARLTLPNGIDPTYPVDVFVETVGAAPEAGLIIESGGATAPLTDRALLHLPAHEHTRVALSVVSGLRTLCTAYPTVRLIAGMAHPHPARELRLLPVHVLGDPIMATVSSVEQAQQDFKIDNRVMPQLFRNGAHVLLRDPNPVTGVRPIESPGDTVPSLFLDTHIEPAQVELRPPTHALSITVSGLEDLRYPVTLVLVNSRRDQLLLNCGEDNKVFEARKADNIEIRNIPLHPGDVRNGQFVTICPVRVLQAGEIHLSTGFYVHYERIQAGKRPF